MTTTSEIEAKQSTFRLSLATLLLCMMIVIAFSGVMVIMTGDALMTRWADLVERQEQRHHDRDMELLRALPSEQPEQLPLSPSSPTLFHAVVDGAHPMRVYLSARFSRQQELRSYAEQLRAEGIEVVSAWHDLESPSSDGFSGVGEERLRWLAMMDLQQLVGTNAVVVFSDRGVQHFGSQMRGMDGEKHLESGVALALGRRILLVGEVENKYQHLPDVERFPAWPECLARICQLRNSDAMSTWQAATEAGVTVQDILRWIRQGRLPAVKRDKRWVIGRNDLDHVKALIARGQTEAQS